MIISVFVFSYLSLTFLLLHHRAALEESAYGRIKQVLRWYLSGFYKKPKVRFIHTQMACFYHHSRDKNCFWIKNQNKLDCTIFTIFRVYSYSIVQRTQFLNLDSRCQK